MTDSGNLLHPAMLRPTLTSTYDSSSRYDSSRGLFVPSGSLMEMKGHWIEESDELRESYEGLGEALSKAFKTQRPTPKNPKSLLAYSLEDVLQVVSESAYKGLPDRKGLASVLRDLDRYFDHSAVSKELRFKSLVWAALTTVITAFPHGRNDPQIPWIILNYLRPVSEALSRMRRVSKAFGTSRPGEDAATLLRIFIDSLSALVQFVAIPKFKRTALNLQSTDKLNEIIAPYQSKMEKIVHEYEHKQQINITSNITTMDSIDVQARLDKMNNITDLLYRTLASQIEVKPSSPKRLLVPPTDKISTPISQDAEALDPGLERYTRYINTPLAESLDYLQGLLTEETSHVAINVLGRPDVSDWIDSEASLLLCIEGYPTGASLNWTSEFSLDVIHAAQEREYVVLYHFCEFLQALSSSSSDGDKIVNWATTTIVKSFLCSLRSQYSRLMKIPRALAKEGLRPEVIAQLDSKETWLRFEQCLRGIREGTIVYIVIDGVHVLRQWSRGGAAKWLRQISSLRNSFPHLVIKALFTSSSIAGQPTDIFKQFKGHEEAGKEDDDDSDHSKGTVRISALHRVLCIRDRKEGSEQAMARLLRSPSKPVQPQQQKILARKGNFGHKIPTMPSQDSTDTSSESSENTPMQRSKRRVDPIRPSKSADTSEDSQTQRSKRKVRTVPSPESSATSGTIRTREPKQNAREKKAVNHSEPSDISEDSQTRRSKRKGKAKVQLDVSETSDSSEISQKRGSRVESKTQKLDSSSSSDDSQARQSKRKAKLKRPPQNDDSSDSE